MNNEQIHLASHDAIQLFNLPMHFTYRVVVHSEILGIKIDLIAPDNEKYRVG